MPSDQSKKFEKIFVMLRFLGIFPGRTPSKCYKYYSVIYLLLNFVLYNILLTLNLLYTPWELELFLREVLFNVTEITVLAQILTIIFMRDKLIEALNIIDCDEFVGDYENKNGILYRTGKTFDRGWKLFMFMVNVGFISKVLSPILLSLIRGTNVELPVCNYYFLSDEVRESYFVYWFIYQSVGIYIHGMYVVCVDSLTAGLLMIAIAQLKVLNNNLSNLKLSDDERKFPVEIQDEIQISRLNIYLKHYEVILKYCNIIQDFLNVSLFFQFGMGSVIICVTTCGLLLPVTIEFLVFTAVYLFTMTMKIFVASFLGSQLTYESQEIMTAAYNSEWIPRSEIFKRNLKLFVERAKIPITIHGLNIFPVSVITFTSIIKTAYSFFTLIRSFQE